MEKLLFEYIWKRRLCTKLNMHEQYFKLEVKSKFIVVYQILKVLLSFVYSNLKNKNSK